MNPNEEFAFIGFSRNDGISGVAALHDLLVSVHSKPAFDFVLVVAADAVEFENGLDFFFEVRGGGKNGQGGRQETQDEKGVFWWVQGAEKLDVKPNQNSYPLGNRKLSFS